MSMPVHCHCLLLTCLLGLVSGALADIPADGRYVLKPGDIVAITVWKEPDLTREVMVAPDGYIAFPLAGTLQVEGLDVTELETSIRDRLSDYISEPEVNVAIKQVNGSRVYVIGKVNRPGMFLLDGEMDVMQALTLAGGTTPFADVDDIRILRRNGSGQEAHAFRYNDVARGRALEQNILLQSGDTVVVP